MRVCSTPRSSAAGAHPGSVQLDDNASHVESEFLLGLLQELNPEGFFTEGDFPNTSCESQHDDSSSNSEVVGTTASQLESLKELIRFDHEYYKKPLESVQPADKNSTPEQSNTVPDTKSEPETRVPDLTVSMDTEPVLMDIPDIYDNTGGFDCDLTDLLGVNSTRNDSYSDSGISDAESSDFPASPLTESNDWQDTFTDLFPSLGMV